METYIPRGGFAERGEARAAIRKMLQGLMTHPEFTGLVDSARPINDFEAGVIRVLKREIEYYRKIPPELLQEEARVTTEAFRVWVRAKERGDFRSFAPHLERVFDIQRRKAELLGYEAHPYDALLDRHEEGLTVRDCEEMFSVVGRLSNLFRRARERTPDEHPLEREEYEEGRMRMLNEHVLSSMGFPWDRARMDVSAHPFTVGLGLDDVRITTWYHGRDFRRSLLAAVHEFGHATYELNVDEAYRYTPVGEGVSDGVHESQSIFWESVVGRSAPFVEVFWDAMAMALPFLRRYGLDEARSYLTMVRPEPIRVEADEVQYVLHVYLRYEIEKGIMEGGISVPELPQVWDDEMERLVGIRPPSDSEGVLQDVHWSQGYVGYFPTYAVGRMLAAQVAAAIGDVEGMVAGRRFDRIMGFLRERIHRWGAVYPPRELIRRALGEDLNPERFLEYLERRYLS